MALDPYERLISYKRRKMAKLSSIPTENVSQNINRLQGLSEGLLRRQNVPVSSLLETEREREIQAAGAINDFVQPQLNLQNQQRSQMQDEIAGLEFKKNIYDEQKKKERDAKKKARDATLTKLGFTAAGIALAPFTGGASIPIASGVGDIAAGMGVGTGDFMGEDTMNEALIAQGLGNTVSSVISTAKTQKLRSVGTAYSDNMDNIINLNPEGLRTLRMQIENAVLMGNYEDAQRIIQSFDYGKYGLGGSMVQPGMPINQSIPYENINELID